MLRKNISILILSGASFLVGYTAKGQIIPVRLTSHNNIVAKAILNKADTVQLMVHTGLSDVMLIEKSLPRLKSIRFRPEKDSLGSWGAAKNVSAFSDSNHLQVSGFEFKNVEIWKDQNSGPETDGKFGLNLFESKVLHFDFEQNQILVSEKLPEKMEGYQKLALRKDRGMYFVAATLSVGGKAYTKEFMIHSGYGGALLLDDDFSSSTQVGKHIEITGEKKLQDSFGNTIITKSGVLPLISLGNTNLEKVPVGFFEGKLGNQRISVLGGDLFKRFNWIFDEERKFVYLKPNRNKDILFTTF